MMMRKVTHANGSVRIVNLGGWRRQNSDSRDGAFRLRANPLVKLATEMDLRPACSPIEDQGAEGSCTAHGFAGVVELNEHAKWLKAAGLVGAVVSPTTASTTITTGSVVVAKDGSITFSTTVHPAATPTPPAPPAPPAPIPPAPPTPPTPTPTAMRVSRAFEYYMARSIEGTTSEDSGATVRDAIQAGVKFGILDEAQMPYIAGQFAVAPNAAQKTAAAAHKVASYHAIADGDLVGIKTAVSAGFAVVFGFQCYDFMLSQAMASTGILKMPTASESLQGGHCVDIVGYSDSTQMVICRNSWGATWGQAGTFMMPYQYVSSPRLASDFWVIVS